MGKIEQKELIKLLKSKGFKITPQRLAICSYVLESKNHPRVDEVYSLLKETYPSLSKGTVYKTLTLLSDLNLVKQICIGDGIIRYDPNTRVHVNLVCTNCGKIIDYESDLVKQFWENLKFEINQNSLDHRIDFMRTCDKCRNKN